MVSRLAVRLKYAVFHGSLERLRFTISSIFFHGLWNFRESSGSKYLLYKHLYVIYRMLMKQILTLQTYIIYRVLMKSLFILEEFTWIKI